MQQHVELNAITSTFKVKKLIIREVKLFVQEHIEKLAETRLKPMHVRTLLLTSEQNVIIKRWFNNRTHQIYEQCPGASENSQSGREGFQRGHNRVK